MEALARFAEGFPDAARDIRLNLSAVFSDGALTPPQRFGVALACAHALRARSLAQALASDGASQLDAARLEDAQAAAALMAMNNVYYRARHMLEKESYEKLPARLRMQRIAAPKTSRLDFELSCLAVSALNGCSMCLKSHEHALLESGASEVMVNDALRIAAVIHAAVVSSELATAQAADA